MMLYETKCSLISFPIEITEIPKEQKPRTYLIKFEIFDTPLKMFAVRR